MNILGLVLPASLQQNELQQSLNCNELRTKCYSVGDVSRPLGNAIKEASQGVKSQESLTDIGSNKHCSEDLGELTRQSSDGNKTAGLASNSTNIDEPIRRTSKKKKQKKGKLNKKQFQNNGASKTDSANMISTTTKIGPKESSSVTRPTEWDQHNSRVRYQSSKEVMDCYVHNEVPSNCDDACSQSSLDPEGLLHISNTDDIECLSRSNSETSKIAVLQDSTSDFCKVDNVNSTELARKHDKDASFPGSVVICATGSCLKDASNCEAMSSSNTHFQDTCGVTESQIMTEDTGCKSMEAYESRSDATTSGTKRSNTNQHRVIADSGDIRNQWNTTSLHMRSQSASHLAHCINSIKMSVDVQEFGKDGSIEEKNSSNQYFKVSEDPPIVTNQDIESYEGQSHTLTDASQLPSQMNNHKRIGKENAYSVWQKTGKNIGSIQTRGRKRSNYHQMCMVTDTAGSISLSKHKSLAGDGLLPRPQSCYADRDGFKQRAKKLGTSDQERCRAHGQVLAEAPELVFSQSLNAGCGQNVSISGEDGSMGRITWEKLNDRLNQPFKQENVRRGFGVGKADLCKPQTNSNIAYREASEISRTIFLHRSNIDGQRSSHVNHHHKFDFSETHDFDCAPSFPACSSGGQRHGPWTRISSHQKLLHEIQPHAATKVPISENVLGEYHHAFLDNENKSSACLGSELCCDNNSKECNSSRVRSQKWIPIGKKDSLMLKSSIESDANSKKKKKFHQKTDIVAVCDEASIMDVGKDMTGGLISGHQERFPWEGKSDNNASGANSKNLPIYIGSVMTTQALDAAYRFQIASECVQLATGSPIAEFEKLLHSASPVIISSVQPCYEHNIRERPILNSFNKFQNIDVLLRDVWRWYERPGNYGLQVKAEEYQNSKGLETNVSFHAHFVPYLSAVQLFVRSQHSSIGSSLGNKRSGVPQKGETEPCSLSSLSQNLLCPELAEQTFVSDHFSSGERHMKPFYSVTFDRDDSCNSLYMPSFSDDSEVAFEYFEHEPPQQRKPFYAKVKELMETDSSNPWLFGDPSKLGNMNLQDLHPASWFSVAWYPIYRIPEGSLRASFLTYHSLGHLVLRCIKSDSLENTAFCAVSPVLGMQSYNAQGECWFRPKKSAGSVSIDDTSFDSSEILKERLRTLEEISALFARGHVHKDQITPNRQPDYEFFLSRKQ